MKPNPMLCDKYKRQFVFLFVVLLSLGIAHLSAAEVVEIPDDNLRRVIESALDKDAGDPITQAEMETVTSLVAKESNISDLTGLQFATNLTDLELWSNAISDLSPLAGLTNLTDLELVHNTISDLSPLAGLTNLTWLWLSINDISDISPLAGLTELEVLSLSYNNISDISALAGLTNLIFLHLLDNNIEDISPLAGLTELERLYLEGNPLNAMAYETHIPAHQSRGTEVTFDPPKADVTGEVVNIPDENLRTAIEEALGKDAGDPITQAEMATLTSLTEIGGGISDLTGLQFAINLTWLWLGVNDISDLSPLAGLTKLGILSLSANNISDISALAGLTELTTLYLWGNDISDISPLAGLTKLTTLALEDNAISDIAPLAGLTELEELRLQGNPLNAMAYETHIPAHQSRGTDVTFDAFDDSPRVEIPDDNLRRVIERKLGKDAGEPITQAEMETVTELLDAWWEGISDLTGLQFATNLTTLSLYDNNISDISPLAGLTKLERLWLYNNNISDLTPLTGFTNLTSLRLHENTITDIAPLAGLTNLTSLSLSDNSITDLAPLAGLTGLIHLWLEGNTISDLAPLARLTQLETLWLHNNNISDLAPLAGLTNLTELNLQGNPLNAMAYETHIPAHQSRGTDVIFDAPKDDPPTVRETNLLAIEGTITQPDGTPAGAGLEVTITIGNNTQTGVSESEGAYSVTFVNLAGSVARSSDTVEVQVVNPATSASASETVELSDEQVIAQSAIIDLQLTVPPIVPVAKPVLEVPAGISLIHVPLKVTMVDGKAMPLHSVGDLYDALGGVDTVSLLITHTPETQRWNSYIHPRNRGQASDKPLTDALGIIASMKAPVSIELDGDPLGVDGRSAITLHPGQNVVGVPLKDSRLTRVSDLFALEGIRDNVSVIIGSDAGSFQVIAQPGDPGDVQMTGGQAFIMTARARATIEITGEGWYTAPVTTAAPSKALTGIQADGATPVLAVSGSIRNEVRGLDTAGQSVTVKNLSTGAMDTTVTDDGGGYQLTFVALETGRAAQIGDTLEISAQSANPLIGVQPLRYVVTAEDVKRSHIPLAELIAYEIPDQTELLLNYPNPFNPETWIPYRLATDADVQITIYSTKGTVVHRFELGHQSAGFYTTRAQATYWDGRNESGERVASGVYFYHLRAGDYSAVRRMVIVK